MWTTKKVDIVSQLLEIILLNKFMDRFYVIPKELKFTDEQQKFLDEYTCYIVDPDIAAGKN